MKSTGTGTRIVLIIALAVAATACLPSSTMEKLSQKSKEQNTARTLTSSDGQSQITIPAGWKEDSFVEVSVTLGVTVGVGVPVMVAVPDVVRVDVGEQPAQRV